MAFCLGLALAWLAVSPAHAVDVRVEGRVMHSGVQTLPEGARLADALLAAQVRPDGYVLGAAWLRLAQVEPQRRLQAGLRYDLDLLTRQAGMDDDAPLQALGQRLLDAVRAMPVTGRERGALLDPRPLEVSTQNHLLAAGDRVLVPARPATVRVTGAVQHDCTLPHQPLRDARRYLDDCARDQAADTNWLYVIQPDGTVQRLGVGVWNRALPQALAPGAVLYVPIRASAADAVDPTLNDDMAAWLATQLLPGMQP